MKEKKIKIVVFGLVIIILLAIILIQFFMLIKNVFISKILNEIKWILLSFFVFLYFAIIVTINTDKSIKKLMFRFSKKARNTTKLMIIIIIGYYLEKYFNIVGSFFEIEFIKGFVTLIFTLSFLFIIIYYFLSNLE